MMPTWLHLYIPGEPGYVFSSSLPGQSGVPLPEAKATRQPTDSFRPRVLVVDDERVIADSMAAILNRNGFDAVAKYGGMDAVDFIHKECPDILLSDVIMPELNGLQLAKATLSNCPKTRIVLISGNAATPNLLEHMSPPGGYPFELLAKPIHPTHLLEILRG